VGKKKRKTNKTKQKKLVLKRKREEKKKERSETPGALDRRNWESQEANPLPVFWL